MTPTPEMAGIGTGTSMDAGNVIVMLLVLVAIIFAAYYVTRLISGKATRMLRSGKMHIVDRLALSRDKQILILRVGDEAHLIGVSNAQITELAQLAPEILRESREEAPGDTFFSRFVSAMKENIASKGRRSDRPKSAYDRARAAYEQSLRNFQQSSQSNIETVYPESTNPPETGKFGRNRNASRAPEGNATIRLNKDTAKIDDMAERLRRRNERLGKNGDDE